MLQKRIHSCASSSNRLIFENFIACNISDDYFVVFYWKALIQLWSNADFSGRIDSYIRWRGWNYKN